MNKRNLFYLIEDSTIFFEKEKRKNKIRNIPQNIHNGAIFISDTKNRYFGYLICFLDNSKDFINNKINNSVSGPKEISYHIADFLESNFDCLCPNNDMGVCFSDIKNEYVYGTNVDCFETTLNSYEKELIDLFYNGTFDEYMLSKNLKIQFIKFERIEFDLEWNTLNRTTLTTINIKNEK